VHFNYHLKKNSFLQVLKNMCERNMIMLLIITYEIYGK